MLLHLFVNILSVEQHWEDAPANVESATCDVDSTGMCRIEVNERVVIC